MGFVRRNDVVFGVPVLLLWWDWRLFQKTNMFFSRLQRVEMTKVNINCHTQVMAATQLAQLALPDYIFKQLLEDLEAAEGQPRE
jgi:hypothetical protein